MGCQIHIIAAVVGVRRPGIDGGCRDVEVVAHSDVGRQLRSDRVGRWGIDEPDPDLGLTAGRADDDALEPEHASDDTDACVHRLNPVPRQIRVDLLEDAHAPLHDVGAHAISTRQVSGHDGEDRRESDRKLDDLDGCVAPTTREDEEQSDEDVGDTLQGVIEDRPWMQTLPLQ